MSTTSCRDMEEKIVPFWEQKPHSCHYGFLVKCIASIRLASVTRYELDAIF